MTSTKDYIRQSGWFTSNGLPDPRMDGPEAKRSGLRFDYEFYMDRIKKFLESLNLTEKRKEFFNR